MPSLSWYLSRLSRMSGPEILHRIERGLRNRADAAGLLTARDAPEPDRSVRDNRWLVHQSNPSVADYRAIADGILAGRAPIFAKRVSDAPGAIDWNRDPMSGLNAPLTFGRGINYRDESRVGNIKYLWEPNRHLEMVTLAQAFAQTGSERYLHAIRAQLNSWLEQCPYLKGVNWASSLELGIRLINWSLTWQLIGQSRSPLFAGDAGALLLARWLRSIFQHVHFIHHNYSRYSSANNHLIGEAAGVFIAGKTWPYWREAEKWGNNARDILIEQATVQVHEDGVDREQAISYQQFVLDFLILAALAGRGSGDDFPVEYWRGIERMIEFIEAVMDVGGNVPMIGDADDGFVVRLSQERNFSPYRSLLATGAVLFDRPDFAAKSGGLDDKTRALVDCRRWDSLWDRGHPRSSSAGKSFPQGGYFILGSGLETSHEVRLIVDAGPLGYLSIAAHGHADALALVLSIGGREILVDPGTYAYHTQPIWRQYFRGTGAHNTIRVDGQDQSVQAGNFMWLNHARARCIEFHSCADGGRFVGEHDGYGRLPDPVIHRREICVRKTGIEVTDRILCKHAHEIERCWHFSEDCRVTTTDASIVAEHGPVRVTLRAAEPVREVRTLRGSDEPPGGWVSRRFDVKVPSDSVYFVNDTRGSTELKTVILWEVGAQGAENEN